MQGHRHWHPKYVRLCEKYDVDVPRGYWFLFNKVGGRSANLGVHKKIFKGYGIMLFGLPQLVQPAATSLPQPVAQPILPILEESDDDADIEQLAAGVEQLHIM